MRLGDLSLFSRTNSRNCFNIAAYHSRHSLTWSWLLHVTFDGAWRAPGGGLRFGIFPRRDNSGLQVVVTLPFVVFHRMEQRPMWYRDLFVSARDREGELERAVSKLRRDVTMARATALLQADEERPQ